MAHLSFASLAPRRYGGLLAVAAGIFALGFASGLIVRPGALNHAALIDAGSTVSRDAAPPLPGASVNRLRFNAQLAYPAEVVRVIDGDIRGPGAGVARARRQYQGAAAPYRCAGIARALC